MSADQETLTRFARQCREMQAVLGPDASLRLRTLIDMILFEIGHTLHLEPSNESLQKPTPPDHEP